MSDNVQDLELPTAGTSYTGRSGIPRLPTTRTAETFEDEVRRRLLAVETRQKQLIDMIKSVQTSIGELRSLIETMSISAAVPSHSVTAYRQTRHRPRQN